MNKRKSRLRLSGILLGVAGMVICGLGFQYVEGKSEAPAQNQPDQFRADIITIDTIKAFGSLERPEVAFLHDAHVDALVKMNKDCTACHLKKDNRLSTKFKRLEDTGKNGLMDLYHESCLGCHKEMAAESQKTGPTEECGYCHRTDSLYISDRQPMGMDKSLHFRHTKALDNKCERCHHEYDEANKKLIYVKNQEGTCRYCHGLQTVADRISMQSASHIACIDCHRNRLDEKLSAGPFMCAGCHDPESQKKIKKIFPVPRIERNQPDMVYVKKDNKDPYMGLDTYLSPKMAMVPFNHKLHETATDTCYVCHHANMTACNSCHTLAGSKEGQQVTLDQAMHQVNSDHSCIGCHTSRQERSQCYGCHVSLPVNRTQQKEDCTKCHRGPSPDESNPPEPMMFDESGQTLPANIPVADEDIPEKVTIKGLTNSYEPVEFPHRKIVRAIEDKIKNDGISNYFHGEKETLCQGCHHNSPPAIKPPNCGSCHGKPFEENDLFKPGLTAAYHGQCMGCHSQMKIEKPVNTDCTGCHAEKIS